MQVKNDSQSMNSTMMDEQAQNLALKEYWLL